MHDVWLLCWCCCVLHTVSSLVSDLGQAQAEVVRLKEWQDVFKRMADDKSQQAAEELQAVKARAADQHAAMAGAVTTIVGH